MRYIIPVVMAGVWHLWATHCFDHQREDGRCKLLGLFGHCGVRECKTPVACNRMVDQSGEQAHLSIVASMFAES